MLVQPCHVERLHRSGPYGYHRRGQGAVLIPELNALSGLIFSVRFNGQLVRVNKDLLTSQSVLRNVVQYDEKKTYQLPLPGTRIPDSNDNIYQHGIAIGAYVQGIRIGVWVVVIDHPFTDTV
jgi:hypothetical protein